MWIHSCHNGHVFLARQDQFVVDHVFGNVSEPVQRTGRVQLHSHARPEVDELSETFHPSRLVVEARADTLPDHVPVGSAADQRHFLHGHDILELFADLFGPSQRLGLQKVLGAPRIRVTVGFPLSVYV